jgi:hypothetical protein
VYQGVSAALVNKVTAHTKIGSANNTIATKIKAANNSLAIIIPAN